MVAIQVYEGNGVLPDHILARKPWLGNDKDKLSHVFPKGGNWRFLNAGKDDSGHLVRFCWSKQRNEGGYFVSWREVIYRIKVSKPGPQVEPWDMETTGRSIRTIFKRYDRVGFKSKKAARQTAERRCARWKEPKQAEQAEFEVFDG